MDKKYTVLIVSSSGKSTDFIKKSGADAEVFEKPETATTAAEAKAVLAAQKFDTVIINAPLDDESGTEFAKAVTAN